MNKIITVVMTGFLLLAYACASVTKDIQVRSESNPKINMSGYKTYTWLGSAQILYDPEGKWEPRQVDMDAEIRLLIDQELRKRGIIQTNDSPDMIIGYVAGVDMAALGLTEIPETKMQIIQNVPKAALVLMFLDAKTGNLIWAGVAKGNVQEQPSNEVVRKRLKFTVKKMFKLLPGS